MIKEVPQMKKRLLAFLLAVSMAVSMLALPAAAAGNANTAVQLSITYQVPLSSFLNTGIYISPFPAP